MNMPHGDRSRGSRSDASVGGKAASVVSGIVCVAIGPPVPPNQRARPARRATGERKQAASHGRVRGGRRLLRHGMAAPIRINAATAAIVRNLNKSLILSRWPCCSGLPHACVACPSRRVREALGGGWRKGNICGSIFIMIMVDMGQCGTPLHAGMRFRAIANAACTARLTATGRIDMWFSPACSSKLAASERPGRRRAAQPSRVRRRRCV